MHSMYSMCSIESIYWQNLKKKLNFGHEHGFPLQIPLAPKESGWRPQCFLGRGVKTAVHRGQFQEGGGDFLAKSALVAEFGFFLDFGISGLITSFEKRGALCQLISQLFPFAVSPQGVLFTQR